MSKFFKGDVTNGVVEFNLLDPAVGAGGGTTATVVTKNTGANVVEKITGDIPASQYAGGSNGGYTVKGLVIGTSCTSIGNYAFNTCTNLTGDLVIPNSVTSIGAYAFADTTFGGAIVIPDSVTSIGSYAFYYCNSFTSLYVNTPASSWVGSNALTGAGLTTIYVNGVTALGYTSGAQTFQGKSLTIAEWTNYPNIP